MDQTESNTISTPDPAASNPEDNRPAADAFSYTESPDEAAEHLRLALAQMARFHLPVNPVNYTLWYSYVSGTNRALREELGQMIEGQESFTSTRLQALFRKHFIQDGETLAEMRHEMREIVHSLLAHINSAGDEFSRYGVALQHFAGVLSEPGLDAQQLRPAVDTVASATDRTQRYRDALENQLERMSSQMEEMRHELQMIREEALSDALTGLANRKAFDSRLEDAVMDAGESGRQFCVLIGDIDHFKGFNDRHGHLMGDKVLRFVANQFRHCLKGRDFAARFGGEEFAVILYDTSVQGAAVVAEEIRHAVSSGELKSRESGEKLGRITISFGVAQVRASDKPRDLIHRADAALYAAKAGGRDQVVPEQA